MAEDLLLKTDKPCSRVKVNVMKIQTHGTFTSREVRELDVKDGVICWKAAGLSLAVMFERYGKNGNISFGLAEGVKEAGSHCNNLIPRHTTCWYWEPVSRIWAAAQNRIIEPQGGHAVAEHGP